METGSNDATIAGAILAGGLSRRMEGPEKTLLELDGQPLVQRIRDRLADQCGGIILNANGDPARFAFLGLPVQGDTVEGFAGPLAGVLAAMDWCAENRPSATHVLTVAGDTPFFPADYAARMKTALAAEDDPETVCLAYSGGNRHPTFGIWPLCLRAALRRFLVEEGERKVMLFAGRYNLVKVEFPLAEDGSDPFFNINTPQDLEQAAGMTGKAG
ncbi:MAG: molybdenum cofactor guanylyltransferase MobA [Nitratireductor sp.]|nr:molybdenum cofactor guanylyltransferase MobA [Nitratireductor sp.]